MTLDLTQLDLTQDYFKLFALEIQFKIDSSTLSCAFLKLQGQWHPDRFASGSDEERRISMQNTSFINTAHNTLTTPRLRARYLLELSDVSFNDEIETSRDPVFLMQQMEIRESIEDVVDAEEPLDTLDEIKADVKQQAQQLEQSFQQYYANDHLDQAKEVVLKMRFMERIFGEIRRLEEKLEDDYF